ncbi:hypothetical protein CANARDRAFT_25731 [[Candida] arabinofermentans NRRL YB-2248]|uniref:C2H2-type domain-containing protein n=1 Tax=[Candida] arabinofermentans NRRL YB-2248 TaxID=983967 RepID=A0A1E4ST56_9ASCO|nr:hypothetical protein CANARDRAFT_25731 [[Candida] arabinofermentans NRRL YB-2248]
MTSSFENLSQSFEFFDSLKNNNFQFEFNEHSSYELNFEEDLDLVNEHEHEDDDEDEEAELQVFPSYDNIPAKLEESLYSLSNNSFNIDQSIDPSTFSPELEASQFIGNDQYKLKFESTSPEPTTDLLNILYSDHPSPTSSIYSQEQLNLEKEDDLEEVSTMKLFMGLDDVSSTSLVENVQTRWSIPEISEEKVDEIDFQQLNFNNLTQSLNDFISSQQQQQQQQFDDEYLSATESNASSVRSSLSSESSSTYSSFGECLSARSSLDSLNASSPPSQSPKKELNKSFCCLDCGSSFTRKSRLNEHIRKKHSGSTVMFPCKLCPKVLSSRENLNRHHFKHCDKFQCHICGKRHDRSDRFAKHVEKCLAKSMNVKKTRRYSSKV